MKSGLYNSYLVRSWRSDDGEQTGMIWRGEVESIQTGQIWRFTRPESMLHFLEEGLGKRTANQGDTQKKEK